LFNLACAAPGWCVASGTFKTTTIQPLLLDDAAGTWSAVAGPLPGNAKAAPDPELLGTACWAVGACIVTGGYTTAAGPTAGVIETLVNGTWSDAPVPLPSGGVANETSFLTGVSCPAVADCMAVGAYSTATDGLGAMSVSDENGVLAATDVPAPPNAAVGLNAGSILYAVSCPSTTWCAAGGTYATATQSNGVGFVATWSDGTWQLQQAPNPAATTESIVTAVSCSWPGSCAAVGEYQSASPTPTGFVDNLTSGVWSGQAPALPSSAPPGATGFFGGPELPILSIACVAGTCTLPGTYFSSGEPFGFMETFPNLDGYQEVAADGGLFAYGTPFFGSMGGQPLNAPIVGMAVVPDSGGYYEVATDGGIFAFGEPFYGSMGGKPLNKPIVGIAFDSLTGGYYEVASDGGIFAFNAPFYGSMGGQPLNAPIVGIAFDPVTGGYYEVASDGGLFAFNAPFEGSMGGQPLDKPIVGMTVDPATGGYFEVASDGGLFAFNAPFQGSMGGQPLNAPIVGMAFDYLTGGYYEVASDGGLFSFNAPFLGSMGGKPLNEPVVGMAFG
jgi:predicted Rdx family selenoprotein